MTSGAFIVTRFLRLALAAFVVSLPCVSPALAAPWPADGRIVYEVLRGEDGMKLGEGVHQWHHEDGRYEMSVELETTGLAAVFVDFRYVQRSRGEVTADGLRPELFTVDQRGRERESASFDWEAGSVLIQRRKGRKESFGIESGDLDVLSVWHLASLRDGRLPERLTLVTNRKAAETDLSVIGDETVELPVGRIDTVHVRLKARSGKLSIDLWLSKAHGLAPLRVLMQDDKGQVLDQRAIEVRVDGAPVLAVRG
tara:strand:- start:9 stop:770 length:762 start_codon:yes stop_codon:yes gene_type:complete